MATGDLTTAYVGRFDAGSAAMLSAVNALNVGAATQGDSTATIHIVPVGDGQSVDIYAYMREA